MRGRSSTWERLWRFKKGRGNVREGNNRKKEKKAEREKYGMGKVNERKRAPSV